MQGEFPSYLSDSTVSYQTTEYAHPLAGGFHRFEIKPLQLFDRGARILRQPVDIDLALRLPQAPL